MRFLTVISPTAIPPQRNALSCLFGPAKTESFWVIGLSSHHPTRQHEKKSRGLWKWVMTESPSHCGGALSSCNACRHSLSTLDSGPRVGEMLRRLIYCLTRVSGTLTLFYCLRTLHSRSQTENLHLERAQIEPTQKSNKDVMSSQK